MDISTEEKPAARARVVGEVCKFAFLSLFGHGLYCERVRVAWLLARARRQTLGEPERRAARAATRAGPLT